MMIADVIRKAETEHEIFFLLTAYSEAVRFCDKLNCLPDDITRLPLGGAADVKTRFEQLILELDSASRRLDDRSCLVIREAVHILGTALSRVELLDAPRYQPLTGMDARAA
jgi:hypothetical protein